MKKRLAFGTAGVAIAVALSLFGTSSIDLEQIAKSDTLPAGNVIMAAADNPYAPAHAAQARVTPVHVAPVHVPSVDGAQAHVAPTHLTPIQVVPASTGIALIIHVPQRREYDRYTDIDRRDAPAVFEPADDDPLPPPRYRSKPRWPLHADEPPPPVPRSTVLSAPPPFADGPTPIRPTPRFVRKIDTSREAIGPLPAPAD